MTGETDEVQRQAREQFGKQSHRYSQGHILADTADVQMALEQISLPKRAAVLDIATGAGFTGLHLARQGHDVTLADIALPMLDRAKEKAREFGLTVRLGEHTAENMPYPPNTFDLVTCRVAAHHFSSPQKFVEESARVLKSGGHLLLIDGTVADDAPEAERWMHEIEKLRDPSHHRFLTPAGWQRLCQAAGLAVAYSQISPLKQPDLNWYFETAATPPRNRERVLQMVADAPPQARSLFRLAQEDGKIVWWWQRLTLIAQKRNAHA